MERLFDAPRQDRPATGKSTFEVQSHVGVFQLEKSIFTGPPFHPSPVGICDVPSGSVVRLYSRVGSQARENKTLLRATGSHDKRMPKRPEGGRGKRERAADRDRALFWN